LRSRRQEPIIKDMHTLLVIDFWVLMAALVVAFGVSLLTGAWRRPRRSFWIQSPPGSSR
jgi:hypothetical protein